MSSSDASALRRRSNRFRAVLSSLAALALAGALAAGAPAPAAMAMTALGMRAVGQSAQAAPAEALRAFTACLPVEQLRALEEGEPRVAGTGLELADLDPASGRALDGLLESLLSPAALAEVTAIREADAEVAGDGVGYHVVAFGDPDADFVVQLSGPDLLLLAVVQDGVVSVDLDVVG